MAPPPLTEEHIFADGAGGLLTANILCERCNRHFGRHIDAPYLKQPFIQVARNAHKLGGRRGNIPQPFEGPHTVTGPSGSVQVKLDADFKPRVIPQIKDVSITPEGGLASSFLIDASDRDKIPVIVRSKFERFFKSPQGAALGWSPQEQRRAIDQAIENYKNAPSHSTPTGEIAGQVAVDMPCLFLEAAKVAFEIAAVEDRESFVESARATHFRDLLGSVRDGTIPTRSGFDDLMHAFDAEPFSRGTSLLHHVANLANSPTHALHIAVLHEKHAVVAMFGIPFIFRNLRDTSGHGAIYSNCVERREVRYMRT
nr:HNH endonuclease [Luteibacter yeojuensis]